MRWASTVSVEADLERAIEETAKTVRSELTGQTPDLALVFLSPHHADGYDQAAARARAALGGGLVIGCSAGGVIGGGTEIEHQPGLSLTAAVLPGVELTPLRVTDGDLPTAGAGSRAWEDLLRVHAASNPHFLLFPDPLSFDTERLLLGLDAAFPGATKIGGLASGGREPGANILYSGTNVAHAGAVGVALSGNLDVATVVAQGCRPIGQPMFVTGVRRNTVTGLDGQRPLDVLQDMFASLTEKDRQIFRHSLFIGVVMDPRRQSYARGDFLIRNILAIDEDSGALAVGALIDENAVVQFHLRDAETSANDLEAMLSRYTSRAGGNDRPAAGSLLFSCLGRGSHLYGRADHDTDAFRRHLGKIPLGGFFCNGEIGQVQRRTYLHGYTSAFGMFRPRT